MVYRAFASMLDQRFNVELDVVVREVAAFSAMFSIFPMNFKLVTLTLFQELGYLNGIEAVQHACSD